MKADHLRGIIRRSKTKSGVQHKLNSPGTKLSKQVRRGMLGMRCPRHGIAGEAILNLQKQRNLNKIAEREARGERGVERG